MSDLLLLQPMRLGISQRTLQTSKVFAMREYGSFGRECAPWRFNAGRAGCR